MRGICLMIGYGWRCWLTAAWIARRRGVSIFEAGSGNPGMANVMALWGPGHAFTTQHNVSATFGGKKSNSYLSMGYLKNNGTIKNTD